MTITEKDGTEIQLAMDHISELKLVDAGDYYRNKGWDPSKVEGLYVHKIRYKMKGEAGYLVGLCRGVKV